MSEFVQVAQHALAQNGFLELDAPKIGECLLELERRQFPLASEHGLDFILQHILGDERITSFVDSIFPNGCVIGHFLRYRAYPGKAVSLWRRRGSEDEGLNAVVVHFLPIGARVNYIQGSHLLELSLEAGSRSLWEVPAADLLAKTGCKKVGRDFSNGGLIILDARTLYVMEQAYVLKCEITTQDIAKPWKKMTLPRTKTIEDKVAAIQSSKIQINSTFQEMATTSAEH